jgi:hypothetical protein
MNIYRDGGSTRAINSWHVGSPDVASRRALREPASAALLREAFSGVRGSKKSSRGRRDRMGSQILTPSNLRKKGCSMGRDKVGPTSVRHDVGVVSTAIDTVRFDVDDERSGKPRADRVRAL